MKSIIISCLVLISTVCYGQNKCYKSEQFVDADGNHITGVSVIMQYSDKIVVESFKGQLYFIIESEELHPEKQFNIYYCKERNSGLKYNVLLKRTPFLILGAVNSDTETFYSFKEMKEVECKK